LHAHEAPLDEARSRQLPGEAEQPLRQAGERVHLAGHEQVERGVGALRRHELGALEIATQEQLIVRAGRGGDAHTLAVHLLRGAQRRGARHEVARFDLEIGREAHQRLARRI